MSGTVTRVVRGVSTESPERRDVLSDFFLDASDRRLTLHVAPGASAYGHAALKTNEGAMI
jgi:hypothetical protein